MITPPTSENGEEVVFEVPYHPLVIVSLVHVQKHKLELSLPRLCDDLLEVCNGLIISDIEIYRKPASCQPRHDGVEGRNAVFVCLCLERLL